MFGTYNTLAALIDMLWQTPDIGLRSSFNYDGSAFEKAALRIHHDEAAGVYLNGTKIWARTDWTDSYQTYDLTGELNTLEKGKNVVAVHCHQTSGGLTMK